MCTCILIHIKILWARTEYLVRFLRALYECIEVNPRSKMLLRARKEKLHSSVQKLLYIAKRARPDVLTSVSFLTTRVQNPTEEDEDKLMRVLKYLNGTRELKLNIRADEGLPITAYIDASDSSHPDGRGHTGIAICVGEGAIYCSSTKQKVNGKSSTEAEIIVGVSDGLFQLL
jgi:hypothetical protein